MSVQRIESLADPRVSDYRDVRDLHLREDAQLFMVEGRLNVARLITESRFRTRSVFVTEAALRGLSEALGALPDEVPVYLASQKLLNQVVGYEMHRGCLAAGERGLETDPEELLAADGPKLMVVLEDVTNPENVGGVFRNAAAFGVHAVLLSTRCADPLYRKAIRVSMGASLRLPFARVKDALAALALLGRAGFIRIALTPWGTPDMLSGVHESGGRIALLLGTEGEGLSKQALAAVDRRVAIPMAAGVDSLNVATAAGIALHHFRFVTLPQPVSLSVSRPGTERSRQG